MSLNTVGFFVIHYTLLFHLILQIIINKNYTDLWTEDTNLIILHLKSFLTKNLKK